MPSHIEWWLVRARALLQRGCKAWVIHIPRAIVRQLGFKCAVAPKLNIVKLLLLLLNEVELVVDRSTVADLVIGLHKARV